MNIKRCFNKASLNCLRLVLLVLIYASLQAFRLSIYSFSQYHYLIQNRLLYFFTLISRFYYNRSFFTLSLIAEGTAEKVLQFMMPLYIFYIKIICNNEQKWIFLKTSEWCKNQSLNLQYFVSKAVLFTCSKAVLCKLIFVQHKDTSFHWQCQAASHKNSNLQWKRISRKPSARWQHLSRLKARALFFFQKKIVGCIKCYNLYPGLVTI